MEITVISGKGGTGKTMLSAALAHLAQMESTEEKILTDCDVDAPNLYLYFDGQDIYQEDFFGGKKSVADLTRCARCGLCQDVCQFDAIMFGEVARIRCEGCGACVLICPQRVLSLKDEKTADVILTKTEIGILSRAEMDVGSEGSGKLITVLRKNAKRHGREKLIISDGSPGIGCPVISSITGTDVVLIVTEPTQSGLKDMIRVLKLCSQFNIQSFVCINKADINIKISERIDQYCVEHNIVLVGKIPFDETVVCSINDLKPIIAYANSPAGEEIRAIWSRLKNHLTIN